MMNIKKLIERGESMGAKFQVEGDHLNILGGDNTVAFNSFVNLATKNASAIIAALQERETEVAVATNTVPAPTPVPSTERLTLVFEPGSVLYGPPNTDADEYREWLWQRMQYDNAVKVDVATLRAHLNTGAEIEHPHADVLRKAVIAPVEKMTVDEYLDRLFSPSGACPF